MNITESEKLARAKRRELWLKWALIGGAVVILFLTWKGCQNEKQSASAYKQIEEQLKTVLNQDKAVREEAKRLRKENSQLDSTVADLVADRDLIQGALIDEADKVKRLSAAV